MGIHTMLASIAKTPELELTDEECERIAKAMQNVAQYYPVYVDAKTQAWMGLIMTAGSVYGTRVFAILARLKAEANEKAATAQNAPNVHTFNPSMSPPRV